MLGKLISRDPIVQIVEEMKPLGFKVKPIGFLRQSWRIAPLTIAALT